MVTKVIYDEAKDDRELRRRDARRFTGSHHVGVEEPKHRKYGVFASWNIIYIVRESFLVMLNPLIQQAQGQEAPISATHRRYQARRATAITAENLAQTSWEDPGLRTDLSPQEEEQCSDFFVSRVRKMMETKAIFDEARQDQKLWRFLVRWSEIGGASTAA